MKEILKHRTEWRIRKFKDSISRKLNQPYEVIVFYEKSI